MDKQSKLHVLQECLYRIPAFPVGAALENYWEPLKEAIRLSSPAFYAVIRDLTYAGLATQPEKVQFTVSKYFNRAQYRATPYGLFAAVGMVPLEAGATGAVLAADTQVHRFVDWPERSQLEYSFENLLGGNAKIFANGSHYHVGTALRYLSRTEDGRFELSEIAVSPLVTQILDGSRQPVPLPLLIRQVVQALPEMTEADVADSIEELILLQLLFTELDANIIGEDYFARRGVSLQAGMPQYLIPVRPVAAGGLPSALFRHLPALAACLARVGGTEEARDLQDFRGRFQKKFEGREVPLMVALDPETGVGYGSLEQAAGSDGLIAQLLAPLHAPAKEPAAKRFLLDKGDNNNFNGVHSIDMEAFFRTLPDNTPVRLPHALPALVRAVGHGQLLLEQMGGATSNSLLGRFSLADGSIAQHCQGLAAMESAANPDVLFFDVAYMAEPRVDNINRRQRIYPLQLSILQYDTSAMPLSPDDLMVSIRGGMVVLRSRSRGKRMVPRIASAYNHQRSDLSLFRFLCDLQYQGLDARLHFAPETYFPKQRYYPRITYRNVILSPAQWALREEYLQGRSLRECLDGMGVSRHFTMGDGDQTLLLDSNRAEDLHMLGMELAKRKKMFLKEALLPSEALLTDMDGRVYNAEYVVTLSHDWSVYEPLPPVPAVYTPSTVPAIIPPAQGWLYWEIYCHPRRADALLLHTVLPWVGRHRDAIATWFFIRYDENGPHIRFRAWVPDAALRQAMVKNFADSLLPALEAGTVTDLRLCTYRRETERYGASLMERVEQHFCTDSAWVPYLLGLDDWAIYRNCTATVLCLMEAEILSQRQWDITVSGGLEAFRREHQSTPEESRLLNAAFPRYRETAAPVWEGEAMSACGLFRQSFREILLSAAPEKRPQLFRDLLHMHVNRLFAEHPRTHEMVLYYLLDRELKKRRHA